MSYWGGSGGGGDNGIPAWEGASAVNSQIGAPMPKKVVAADLSNGQLTVRLRVRVGTPLLSKTLLATSASPLAFWVENKGQQLS